MPPVIGISSARHASPMPRTASASCHMISGRSGLPKFRLFVAPIGSPPAHATLRADSATASMAPAIRIQIAESAVAIDGHGQPAGGALHADDAGRRTRPGDGISADRVIVLPIGPALAGDDRRRQQRLKCRLRFDRRRECRRTTASARDAATPARVIGRRYSGASSVSARVGTSATSVRASKMRTRPVSSPCRSRRHAGPTFRRPPRLRARGLSRPRAAFAPAIPTA